MKIKIGISAICFILLIILIGLLVLPFSHKYNMNEYGDYVGGVVGTFISLITLILISFQLTQVNNQTLQNTIALLLQSYQHTVEDFDYIEIGVEKPPITGREGIRKLLENDCKAFNLEHLELENQNTNFSDWLTKSFPTHIPAIIVSILHIISEKKEIEKQIKSMLSYEERELLILFTIEQIYQGDDSYKHDWPLIKSLLNLNDDPEKNPPYLKKYKNMFKTFNEKIK
jgi:hypothetical protein